VEVRIKGVSDLYPSHIRMVKPGDAITIAGRYHRAGPVEVVIRGKVSGETVTRRLTVDLVGDGGDPAVARLWAARRIGHLLDEARQAGKPDLHKREIVQLGRRFGIVTPHTSLLVLESDDQQRFLGGMRRRPLLVGDGGEVTEVRAVTREHVSGAELARRIRDLRRCESGAANPFADLLGANRLKLRRIGDRTFYRDERHIWVEADLVGREPANPRIVRFLSDEWQELADQGGEVAKALSLGSKVLLTLPDGQAVRVVD
jgi:Ca-activated chloride channel family protein